MKSEDAYEYLVDLWFVHKNVMARRFSKEKHI